MVEEEYKPKRKYMNTTYRNVVVLDAVPYGAITNFQIPSLKLPIPGIKFYVRHYLAAEKCVFSSMELMAFGGVMDDIIENYPKIRMKKTTFLAHIGQMGNRTVIIVDAVFKRFSSFTINSAPQEKIVDTPVEVESSGSESIEYEVDPNDLPF